MLNSSTATLTQTHKLKLILISSLDTDNGFIDGIIKFKKMVFIIYLMYQKVKFRKSKLFLKYNGVNDVAIYIQDDLAQIKDRRIS